LKSLKNYLIPALLSLIVGVLLWQIQRDVISLEYNVTASEVFPRESGVGRFFVIDIRNTGSKEVQKIAFKINFTSGQVETFKFSNKDLVEKLNTNISEIEGEIPLLNEGEKISVTVTAIDPKVVSSPIVSARAVGITATEAQDETFTVYIKGILVPLTGIAIALTLVSIWSSIKQVKVSESVRDIEEKGNEIESLIYSSEKKRTEWEKENEKRMLELEELKKNREQGRPEREQKIFTMLNKNDLAPVFVNIIRSGNEMTYRDTAFHIIHSMLLDELKTKNYIKALEELSDLDNNIAPISKGLIMYLCGKAYKYTGDDLGAETWFNKCKEETPLMYQHLMSHDRYYDLEKVKEYLKLI